MLRKVGAHWSHKREKSCPSVPVFSTPLPTPTSKREVLSLTPCPFNAPTDLSSKREVLSLNPCPFNAPADLSSKREVLFLSSHPLHAPAHSHKKPRHMSRFYFNMAKLNFKHNNHIYDNFIHYTKQTDQLLGRSYICIDSIGKHWCVYSNVSYSSLWPTSLIRPPHLMTTFGSDPRVVALESLYCTQIECNNIYKVQVLMPFCQFTGIYILFSHGFCYL